MLQRCTADSCSVFPPGALGRFFAKLLFSQLVSRLSQMQDLIFAFVEHHEVMYTIRYRCSFWTHNALLQMQLSACTCIHQVYRFMDTFYQSFC